MEETSNKDVEADVKAENPKSDKELNFERLRKKLEGFEEKYSKAQEQIEKQQEMLNKFQGVFSDKDSNEDDYEALPSDEWISKGQFEKMRKKERDEIKKELMYDLQMQEQNRFQERLKSRYSDYDNVVNEESVAELEKTDPWFSQVAQRLANHPDGKYEVGEAIYNKIKSLNQTKQDQEKQTLQKKMQRNKPASLLSTIGQVSFGMPNAYDFDVSDPAARERVWESIQRAKKGGSFR